MSTPAKRPAALLRFPPAPGISIIPDRATLPWLLAAVAAAALIARAPVLWAALAATGLAVAVVTLVRPWMGLVLLALVTPFAAVRPVSLAGVSVDASDLLLALIVAAWLGQGVVRRRITLPAAPLTWPLVGFLVVASWSLLAAVSLREALPELVKWLQVLLLYWCVAALLPPQRVGWLLAALVAAGVGQALIGLYQFFTQAGPEGFILFGRFMRAYGTYRQPNPYAGYLGLVAPLALSLSLLAWSPEGRMLRWRRLLRFALPAATAVIAAGLLVSWSRGAWLAFVAATTAVAVVYLRRASPAVLFVGGVAVLALLAAISVNSLPPWLVQRFSDLGSFFGMVDVRRVEVNDANFAVVERVAHWLAAAGMWADHLWLGVGLGNYAVAYSAYALPRWQDPLGHAHNVYLNFGAETGLLGLMAYLVLWTAAVVQALKAALGRRSLLMAVGAGALGALVHATVHNLFDNLWVQHIALQLGFLLGLIAVLTAEREHDNPHV
ncbi:MAG: O-antigen ligase family protein [Caldilineales bacterium]|nr:O-antigen ligase family protein [Caldilineales bacterium]MDW8318201.1 O-antigen ligase family protein [Anaerolineae bacterium]